LVAKKPKNALVRKNRELRYVPLGKMRVSPLVQRELRPPHVDYLVSIFDLDKVGNPEVSARDGWFYVMDGQHRIEAIKTWLGEEWKGQQIQCWVATGLTEQEEADVFLGLNDKLNVDAFQKFKISLQANRPLETAIAAQVDAAKLHISKQDVPGAVSCIGTLRKVYLRSDGLTLRRALQLVRDSYGDPGLKAHVIEGLALLCQRYSGVLDDKHVIKALSATLGGASGLLGRATAMRQATGNSKSQCVAAAAVDIINGKRVKGSKRLPPWWKNS
jgi:hypothetical protein